MINEDSDNPSWPKGELLRKITEKDVLNVAKVLSSFDGSDRRQRG